MTKNGTTYTITVVEHAKRHSNTLSRSAYIANTELTTSRKVLSITTEKNLAGKIAKLLGRDALEPIHDTRCVACMNPTLCLTADGHITCVSPDCSDPKASHGQLGGY